MFQAIVLADEMSARTLSAYFMENEETGALSSSANELPAGGWSAEILFLEEPDAAMLAAAAEAALGSAVPFDVSPLPDLDWVAKSLEGLAPVFADRFAVFGSHDREKIPVNALGIEIEAAQAFGTGHHATTWGCLMMLARLLKQRRYDNPLDLGCGSGVLAIALAKWQHRPVLASDIDPLAARIAKENARLNGVGADVEVIAAKGFDHHRFAVAAPFDLVVANILARPLMALAPRFVRSLESGADVVLSGLRAEDVMRVRAAYVNQGLSYIARIERDGWATMHLRAERRG